MLTNYKRNYFWTQINGAYIKILKKYLKVILLFKYDIRDVAEMADQLKLGSDETEKKNFRSSKRSIDVNNVNIEKNIRIY